MDKRQKEREQSIINRINNNTSEVVLKSEAERIEIRDKSVSIGISEGLKYGTVTSAVVGAGTVYLNHSNEKFKKFLSISAKVSFPVMAFIFMFSVVTELTINDTHLHPESYGLNESSSNNSVIKQKRYMPIHHKFFNYVYGNYLLLYLL